MPDPSLPLRGAFAYGDDLRARLAAAAAQPRSARTRLRLMEAVAAVLESDGVHGLRVASCATRAGVAHGTFYRYWPDGRTAAHAVMSDLMATIRRRRPASPRDASPWRRIVTANRYYVEVYRRNAGLMRCLQQLADAEPDFARIAQDANLALAQRVVRAWLRSDPAAASIPEAERLGRALACSAMVDGMLRDVLLRAPAAPLAAMTPEAVADLLSASWHRLLFGREPPAD
jgi:AcrR family transcriptional regulator